MEILLKLLTELIKYSSWPIAVIILACIFRRPLLNLRKIKVKDYEVEIGEEIKSLSKKVKKEKKNKDWEVTSKKYLKDNMEALAEKSPLAVILQAWELLSNMVAIESEKVQIDKNLSICIIVQTLYDKEYMGMESLNLFLRLYALKEKMKNYENEEITKNRALEYADTALEVGDCIVREIKFCAVQKNSIICEAGN